MFSVKIYFEKNSLPIYSYKNPSYSDLSQAKIFEDRKGNLLVSE
jgi:hypothetical protein